MAKAKSPVSKARQQFLNTLPIHYSPRYELTAIYIQLYTQGTFSSNVIYHYTNLPKIKISSKVLQRTLSL